MDFGTTIKMLRLGHALTRTEWSDSELTVELRDELFWRREDIVAGHHDRVALPWQPTIKDVLAEDWELVR